MKEKNLKPRRVRVSKSPTVASRRAKTSIGQARKLAEVQAERDAFAKSILDRIMPELGPIDFTKRELLLEASRQPSVEELIDSLVAESES